MYTHRDAGIYHIRLLIILFMWICNSTNAKTYKIKDSNEQASEEEPIPFPAEFGEFFVEKNPQESGENFGFSGELTPDYIPYSESRNVTRYIHPTETYHSVQDMPLRGRGGQARNYKGDHGYRKEEPNYRKEYRKDVYRPADGSYSKEATYQTGDPYRKGGDNYRRGESYKKGDSYRTDDGYRKSDSYRNQESFRKDEPRQRSGNRDYYKERSGHRRHESYRKDGDRPSYKKEESSYHQEEPSYRKDDSRYVKEHREDRNYRKKPIQNLYDDWSPEDDKSSSVEREERTEEEEEEPDYPDREEEPPRTYKEGNSRKPAPASLRPGPPYYTPNFKRPADVSKAHVGNGASRHHSPTPPPQTFYAPSAKSNSDPSRQFQHRKGELAATKQPQFEKGRAEFRPSPPDPLQNSKSQVRDDYPESEYSSPASQTTKLVTPPLPVNRQNCVKLKKMEHPPNANGKYVKNMMTCYVCVDEKTGSNYEECSYESDSQSKPYLKTGGEEQTLHTKISHREKRDTSTILRMKRQKDYYDSDKEKHSYKVDSDAFDDKDDLSDMPDKDEDDIPDDYDSEDNCYRKKKGDMSCIVCESPNKQGLYEQCSYQSDPKKNRYEHSFDRVYGSPRLPQPSSKYSKNKSSDSGSDEYDSSGESPLKSEYSSSDFEEPTSSLSRGKSKTNRNLFRGSSFGFGLDNFDFGDLGDKSSKSFEFGDSFDFDSIPEPAEIEGRFYPQDDDGLTFKSGEMPDVGGFVQKNRSDCKKVIKNKMTCYQCVGSKGAKQEECMYVAEPEPKKKHLSFSQVQEFNSSDPNNPSDIDSKHPTFSFGKRKYKKYNPDLTDIKFFNKLKEKATMEASRWPRSPLMSPATMKKNTIGFRKHDQGAASHQRYDQDEADDEEEEEEDENEDEESEEESESITNEEYNAAPTDPPEIDYKEAEKGEFHKDTESAWDPKMGISLPRYMLEKSEHEAMFDEVLASG